VKMADKKTKQQLVIFFRTFLPPAEPVMPGEPCEWNDCLKAIDKNLKEFEGGK